MHLAPPELTSSAVLKLQPADQDAIKCKVAVLLEGGLFDEALEYISSTKSNSFQFEEVRTHNALPNNQDNCLNSCFAAGLCIV